MRGQWLLVSGAVILLAVAAGALRMHYREHAAPNPRALSAPPLPAEINLPGKIRAQHVTSVGAPVDGTLESFLADVGDEVYEGQSLAVIKNGRIESAQESAASDAERAQARLNDLESRLAAARLEASRAGADFTRIRGELSRAEQFYLRQQMLNREGATPRLRFEKSQQDYQSVKADFTSREAVAREADDRATQIARNIDMARKVFDDKNQALDQANRDLAASQVHSPVNGVIVGRHGQEGGEVSPAIADLFQIAVDLTLLEVVVDVEPALLAALRPGQPAAVLIAELGGESLPAAVKDVGNGQAVIEFSSPNPAIKPGLSAQVRIRLK